MTHDPQDWVELGKIVRPHGVRGELRVALHNPDSEVLLGTGEATLRLPDGTSKVAVIASARTAAYGIVLLTIEGVDDRDGAEALRNTAVCVPRSILEQAGSGEFYVHDIMGADVTLVDGTPLGKVTEHRAYPTIDVLVISGNGHRYEVPLIDDFVAEVDPVRKRVVLHSVDGLEA